MEDGGRVPKIGSRKAWAAPWLCRWCVHPRTGEKWWDRGDFNACSSCQCSKGAAFGGPKPLQTAPSFRAPALERDKQRQKAAVTNYAVERDEQLKAKDLQIAKLREQVLAAKNGQTLDTDT
eukprot:6177649-Pyramimonas_sp.AAC.1